MRLYLRPLIAVAGLSFPTAGIDAGQRDARAQVWEVLVDAAPARVWTAVLAPSEANAWTGGRLHVDTRVGGTIQFVVGPHRFTGLMVAVEAPRTFEARIVSVSSPERRARDLEGSTWVSALVPDAGGGTVLRVSVASATHDASSRARWIGHPVLLALTRLREQLPHSAAPQ